MLGCLNLGGRVMLLFLALTAAQAIHAAYKAKLRVLRRVRQELGDPEGEA